MGLRWLAGKVRTQVTSMVGRPSVAAQASSLLLGRGDRQPKLVQLWGWGAGGLVGAANTFENKRGR